MRYRTFAWAVAATGAGLAGVLLFAAASTVAVAAAAKKRGSAVKADDSTQVLIRIGREAITRGEVQKQIESLPPQFRTNYQTPEGRQQLLDRMIEERVWLTLALREGVGDRPQVREQLERQRREVLVRIYLNEMMEAAGAPTDSEAVGYYEDHRAEYKIPATITVSHIQTRTEKDALRVRKWVDRKFDWSKLVTQYSTDTLTRAGGGSLGAVTRGGPFGSLGTQPALAESAFALGERGGEGAVGGPYATQRGWHVLRIDAVKPESERPFDQVKPVILRQLRTQNSQDFYRAKLAEARERLKVQPDSAAIRGFLSQRQGAREMFEAAQAMTDAAARIEAYRRLLAEHPDADVSPQAQFMVGFIYSEELRDYERAEEAFRALLERYPDAELAASARWMLEHMRTEETPDFITLEDDSTAAVAPEPASGPTGKP